MPRSGRARDAAEGPKIDLSDDWLTGEGIALTMIDTVPPDAISPMPGFRCARMAASNWWLHREFGNGTSTVHRQIAATALATTVDQIRLLQSDTAHGGHDTGAYGSAGTLSPDGRRRPRRKLADDLRLFASTATRTNPMPASLKTIPRSAAGDACRMFSSRKPACAGRLSVRPAPRRARRGRWPSMCRAFASR